MSWLRRLFGEPVPDELRGALAENEHVLAAAAVGTGGHVAVTALGLWLPGSEGPRRVGWHLISKAVWQGDALTVTEAEETGYAGRAVLLADRPPARYVLARPGKLPHLVRQRVEGAIRSRYRKDLASGGAWFVVRKVPGTDGSVLQVRPDPGTDLDVVAEIAEEAARKLAGGTP
ncbi:hypothetical protein [Prauserella muralis]|uniref:Uncharacterized protein n=1 Tax=Prauserella muralis TaxID=588067 RepID=A0A2V4B087_9PSEU|nr:hypothetical protein [Prauserella muralis]PXY27661.1 hypothetical protein BAY60_14765 [Prauserella muralis]TWE22603.1 hypothetical protein FHX69_3852 [Prauserella muralis]